MTLEQRKYKLIQEIISVNQSELIDAIDDLINRFASKPNTLSIDLSNHSNIEKEIEIEKIKKDRPIKQLNIEEFSQEADTLNWDKSIEELLTELN